MVHTKLNISRIDYSTQDQRSAYVTAEMCVEGLYLSSIAGAVLLMETPGNVV